MLDIQSSRYSSYSNYVLKRFFTNSYRKAINSSLSIKRNYQFFTRYLIRCSLKTQLNFFCSVQSHVYFQVSFVGLTYHGWNFSFHTGIFFNLYINLQVFTKRCRLPRDQRFSFAYSLLINEWRMFFWETFFNREQ
jgi:hypothetical protein